MTTKPVDGQPAPATDATDDNMTFDLAFDEAAAPEPIEPKPAATEPDPEPAPKAEPEVAPVVDPKEDTWKAEKAELERQLAEARKPAPAPEPKKEEPKAPEPDAEEAKTLAEFMEDWPSVKSGVDILIKQAKAEMQAAFDAQLKQIQGTIAPAVNAAALSQQEKFNQAIAAAHPDITTLYPELEAWVDKQPARLKASYNAILDHSTADELIGLISTFKAAAGKAATAPVVPAATAADPDKEGRLARMEGVKRSRTGASAEIDEDDFDAAFAAASRGN